MVSKASDWRYRRFLMRKNDIKLQNVWMRNDLIKTLHSGMNPGLKHSKNKLKKRF